MNETVPMDPKELKDRIKGIIHLVMTHFDENNRLDENALRKSINYTAKALRGEDAVFLAMGSTAEFYSMNEQENKQAMRIIVEEVDGRFPVIVGTGRAGTKPTIEMSQYAQQIGADGVLIVNPYYLPATQEGLFRHFKKTADSIDIGIMIYNNSAVSKLWIPPELMARLSKIENIIADKENTANAIAYYWMQKALDPEDMVIICGLGQLMFPFFALYGCNGFVTEYANFAPDIALDLYKAAKEKNFDKIKQLSDRIAPFHEFLAELARKRGFIPSILSPQLCSNELPFYQAVIKQAMTLVGLPGGQVREPMENLTKDEIQKLRTVLQRMGVL